MSRAIARLVRHLRYRLAHAVAGIDGEVWQRAEALDDILAAHQDGDARGVLYMLNDMSR